MVLYDSTATPPGEPKKENRSQRSPAQQILQYCRSFCQGRLFARTCKVFRFARKLNTAPADLESRPRAPPPQSLVAFGVRVRVRVRVRVEVRARSGVGSGWTGHLNRRLCGPAHREPPYINRYSSSGYRLREVRASPVFLS